MKHYSHTPWAGEHKIMVLAQPTLNPHSSIMHIQQVTNQASVSIRISLGIAGKTSGS
jgi:hypothetical protein